MSGSSVFETLARTSSYGESSSSRSQSSYTSSVDPLMGDILKAACRLCVLLPVGRPESISSAPSRFTSTLKVSNLCIDVRDPLFMLSRSPATLFPSRLATKGARNIVGKEGERAITGEDTRSCKEPTWEMMMSIRDSMVVMSGAAFMSVWPDRTRMGQPLDRKVALAVRHSANKLVQIELRAGVPLAETYGLLFEL